MKTITKNTKLKGAETKLEKHVQRWVNDFQAHGYENVQEILGNLQNGCSSGIVSHLIYFSDTVKFFKKYKSDIATLLGDTMNQMGASGPAEIFGNIWDSSDPLASETNNQNLLAWFAFEETAFQLANKNGIEL